ncbi:MAG: hypothetical protein KF904_18705 [Rhodoblastus sp.]|nr:hypothetical protein [Rhodoblastus sp.]
MQVAVSRFADVSKELARSSHKPERKQDELWGELEGIIRQITLTHCASLVDCIDKLSVAVMVIDEADSAARHLLQSAYADLKRIAGA